MRRGGIRDVFLFQRLNNGKESWLTAEEKETNRDCGGTDATNKEITRNRNEQHHVVI